LLGEPLSEGSALEAVAQVSHDEDGRFTLVLDIKTAEGEGTRSLRADTCDGLLDLAAFSIALAINPDLEAAGPTKEASAEPPRLEPTPPPAAAPPRETPAGRSQPDPKSAPPELWLGAAGVLDTALLPRTAWGLRGFADVLVAGKLRLGLSGSLFLPQTRQIAGGAGGDFSLWLLGVHACYQAALGVPLAGCATLESGRLSGEGRGVPNELSQHSQLWMPGVSVLAAPALARSVAAVVGVSGRFPTRRDRFVVKSGELLKIPAWSLEVWMGIGFRAL